MTKSFQDAVKKIGALPEDYQAYATEVLEQIAAGGSGTYSIPPEDREAVEEALAQATHGDFIEVRDSVLNQAWR